MSNLEIVWTKVDEAPGLATYSLLPIVEAFVGAAGVKVKLKDISLTGRIIANFPDKLTPAQKLSDELAELGKLTLEADANIIKLPNISASIPQLKAAIKELQSKGYDVPNYPDSDATPADKELRARYGRVLGSRRQPGAAGRAIPTAAPPAPSSNTPVTTRIRWAPGARTPRRMWRSWRTMISTARKSAPPSPRPPMPASNWSAPTAP